MKKYTNIELEKNIIINYELSKSLPTFKDVLIGDGNLINRLSDKYNGKENDKRREESLSISTYGNIQSSNTCGKSPGRKKTHPVWIFFKDLKDEKTNEHGIICLHCKWKGTDKSPNYLQVHLKKFHSNDGIYGKYCTALSLIPIHPYSRKKGGSNDRLSRHLYNSGKVYHINNSRPNSFNLSTFNPFLNSLSLLQDKINESKNNLTKLSNEFQDNSVIKLVGGKNITSAFTKDKIDQEILLTSPSIPNKENFFTQLFGIAKDLGISITYTYDNHHEFLFSKRDIHDRSVILKDYPNEIKVYEKTNNNTIECEVFKKCDWTQMNWAIRGRIQSILFKED
uniref:BED-type domain-containing protein n=1 Tax=Strongyloides papillosus TaxID=174720 RepID=A0A0N5B4E8_STREA